MKYGLAISPMGPWGDPQRIAELAVLAEGHGWDGVFCEEYLIRTDGQDAHDVWLTLALIAQATGRITLGTMVTPADLATTVDRRRPGRDPGPDLRRPLRPRRRQRRQQLGRIRAQRDHPDRRPTGRDPRS